MKPYLKFIINSKRRKYLRDRKLRPIKINGFVIQPVIINPFRRDHRFRFDASYRPITYSVKKQTLIKRRQNKIFHARTTLSTLKDIVELAIEEINILNKPKFIFNTFIQKEFRESFFPTIVLGD